MGRNKKNNAPEELLAMLATEMPGVEISRGKASSTLDFPDEDTARRFVDETLKQIPIMKYLKTRREGTRVSISVPPIVRSMINRHGGKSISDYLPVTVTD